MSIAMAEERPTGPPLRQSLMFAPNQAILLAWLMSHVSSGPGAKSAETLWP